MPASHKKDSYSTVTGVIFVFNLIVGTGALALPGALQTSGLLIGLFLLMILGMFSFMTVTFIVEALAAANAVSRKRYENQGETSGQDARQNLVEKAPLVPRDKNKQDQESDVFEMTEKYEIGQMGVLMTPRWSQVVTYLCLCLYLFGDIAIYEAVVGRTGAYVICTVRENTTKLDSSAEHRPCWAGHKLSKMNVYRIVIFCFVILLGPFVFFNVQKTKSLQILTTIMRWVAFLIAIIWASYRLVTVGQKGHPAVADFEQMPTLFGTLVYSFMCQHSIPGLIYPISNKSFLSEIIGFDYVLVAVFYVSLNLTAVFTFSTIQDLYTLNFWALTSQETKFTFQRFLAYYLALFPVFTLSTSFPIISITLRNNLRSLCLRNRPYVWYYDRLLFPLLTVLPPTALALLVSDLHLLVGVIGSYCGTGVQYLIPCLLVQFARKQTKDLRVENPYASPFRCALWVYIVYAWMVISLIIITVNYVREFWPKH